MGFQLICEATKPGFFEKAGFYDGPDGKKPMDQALSLADLASRATDLFQRRFGRKATYVVAAPGRVNLIGEHTDYNDGFVLPMAIDRYTVIAADTETGGNVARVFSTLISEMQEIPLTGGDVAALPMWTRYLRGVFDVFAEEGLDGKPFAAVIESTVPLGSGLSSSAALEVATATLIETMCGQTVAPVRKALLCQRAEHQGAGVPCGIMDQFSSVLCEAGRLMLLDCRNQQHTMVPLADPSLEVLIINSNVKHELTGGEYAERRKQCEAAAAALGVESLRDVSATLLDEHKRTVDPILYRRASHVVGENLRTVAAARAIEDKQWQLVGELMYASHESLSSDYEVSCPELDGLVDAARQLGPERGVIGSRMTGGGFGGCTVSLVNSTATAEIARAICGTYQAKTGIVATAFATRPAQGARVLDIPAR